MQVQQRQHLHGWQLLGGAGLQLLKQILGFVDAILRRTSD